MTAPMPELIFCNSSASFFSGLIQIKLIESNCQNTQNRIYSLLVLHSAILHMVHLVLFVRHCHTFVRIREPAPTLRICVRIRRSREVVSFDFRFLASQRLLGGWIVGQFDRLFVVHTRAFWSWTFRANAVHQDSHGRLVVARLGSRRWPTVRRWATRAGNKTVHGGPMEMWRDGRLVVWIDLLAQIVRLVGEIAVRVDARNVVVAVASVSAVLAKYETGTDGAIL